MIIEDDMSMNAIFFGCNKFNRFDSSIYEKLIVSSMLYIIKENSLGQEKYLN